MRPDDLKETELMVGQSMCVCRTLDDSGESGVVNRADLRKHMVRDVRIKATEDEAENAVLGVIVD